MSTATKGRRTEHRVRAVLEANGYEVVRAAGSKGPCDLVAWFPGHDDGQVSDFRFFFINIKSAGWPGTEELRDFGRRCPGRRRAILWPKRGEPRCCIVSVNGTRGQEEAETKWFRGLVKCAREKERAGLVRLIP